MKRILKIVFCILIGIILLPAVLYFIPFHGNTLSTDKETWNTFSYVWSASLGTGISAITLFILLLDRKSDSYEKKTNQFIDFLFRQNDTITKHYQSGGYTDSPVDTIFLNYNERINEIYVNNAIYEFLESHKLSNCDKEVQDYICFGYQIALKTDKTITPEYFDNKLSEHFKRMSIKNAPKKQFTIEDKYGDAQNHFAKPSPIKNNLDLLENCKIQYNPKTMNAIFLITKDKTAEDNFPFAFYSFLNTYRYAVKHLIDYPEGLNVYFSQLTLEQKIFIAYDISSYADKKIFNKIKKPLILKEELLSNEVRDNGLLINYIYSE
ncbi:MAG: hypothetical protein IJ530_02965 [Treponema sp.]|uniref:hypothetical protein n=1 Tax=Treponema sp. TaxID=166 RepID=UPI0025F45B21|nr:hypothetical protein [Treponema sp.]MBQ8678703.1 hypothetical protein [Treponema sp.]